MANSDLPIRFSDETYATKFEVSRALGTSLVDTIWSNILNYRSHFTRVLSLRNIEKNPLNVVLTPSILERCNALERKLNKVFLRYARMDENDPGKRKIKVDNYAKILYWVAKKYNLTVSESFLHTLILSNISALTPEQMILQRYQDALKTLESHPHDPLDENFFANMYSLLTGNPELVSLYRENEIGDVGQKALIGRMYVAAPVERLPDMMENYLDFIQNSDLGTVVKAILTYFFFVYVKPFEYHSEEMAILSAKCVLAHGDYDDLAAILDLESLLSYNQDQLTRIFTEVQKTNDTTYLLVYVLDLAESIASDLLDRMTNISMSNVKSEFYEAERPAPKPVEVVKPAPEVVKPTVDPQRVYEKPVEASKPVEVAPAKPREVVAPTPAPVVVEKPVEVAKPSVAPVPSYENSAPLEGLNFEMKVALPTMPIGLDEKDAARIEENLLEINPKLKRGEAYFYARHCTIGKYYTIAQYKKTLGCAYETARTSMDHLVYEGYYRKEMLKNKFIYTPIPRR